MNVEPRSKPHTAQDACVPHHTRSTPRWKLTRPNSPKRCGLAPRISIAASSRARYHMRDAHML
eukprot:3813055-Prymnesium_polylepis.1